MRDFALIWSILAQVSDRLVTPSPQAGADPFQWSLLAAIGALASAIAYLFRRSETQRDQLADRYEALVQRTIEGTKAATEAHFAVARALERLEQSIRDVAIIEERRKPDAGSKT